MQGQLNKVRKCTNQMYSYTDLPPNDNPNPQGAYPPPPYPAPNGYYRQPNFHPVWRLIGMIALIWLVGAVVFSHHGLWLIMFFGVMFLFMRSRRWRHDPWHYGRHYHRRNRQAAMPPYYYSNPGSQPGYYPPQPSQPYYYPPQPQPPSGTSNWPAPGEAPGTDHDY